MGNQNLLLIWFGYFINSLTFIYYLTNFLKPRFQVHLTIGLNIIYFLLISWMHTFVLFRYVQLKIVTVLLSVYISTFLFYKNTLGKMLIAPPISLGVNMLVEIPFDFALINIFGFTSTTLLNTPIMFFTQIIMNIIVLILLKFILNKKITNVFFIRKNFSILFILSFQFYFACISVSQTQVMDFLHLSLINRYQFIFLMFLGSCLITILIFIYYHKLHKKMKLELSVQKTMYAYQHTLDSYLKTNDEFYQYLRHDIMNQLIENERSRELHG